MQRRFALASALAAMAIAFGCTKAPSDAAMAQSIKAQMFSDQQLKNANLNITVNQGVATISGDVSDDSARLEAYKLAAQTPGIKKVDDQMSVEAPQATLNPAPSARTDANAGRKFKAKAEAEQGRSEIKTPREEAHIGTRSPQSPDRRDTFGSADEQTPQPAPVAPTAPPTDTTQTIRRPRPSRPRPQLRLRSPRTWRSPRAQRFACA